MRPYIQKVSLASNLIRQVTYRGNRRCIRKKQTDHQDKSITLLPEGIRIGDGSLLIFFLQCLEAVPSSDLALLSFNFAFARSILAFAWSSFAWASATWARTWLCSCTNVKKYSDVNPRWLASLVSDSSSCSSSSLSYSRLTAVRLIWAGGGSGIGMMPCACKIPNRSWVSSTLDVMETRSRTAFSVIESELRVYYTIVWHRSAISTMLHLDRVPSAEDVTWCQRE